MSRQATATTPVASYEGCILTKTSARWLTMRVLVVEDDPSVGAAIQMILDRERCDTVRAQDADSAMTVFESSPFDLAIVDIFMPGMNGLEVIAGLRLRTASMPILAISGFRFRDSMNPALDILGLAVQAGAAVCLRKPFSSQQLISAVHASLDPAVVPSNQQLPTGRAS
jgi:DNA-binding response OmpR family regulator